MGRMRCLGHFAYFLTGLVTGLLLLLICLPETPLPTRIMSIVGACVIVPLSWRMRKALRMWELQELGRTREGKPK